MMERWGDACEKVYLKIILSYPGARLFHDEWFDVTMVCNFHNWTQISNSPLVVNFILLPPFYVFLHARTSSHNGKSIHTNWKENRFHFSSFEHYVETLLMSFCVERDFISKFTCPRFLGQGCEREYSCVLTNPLSSLLRGSSKI